MAGVRWTVFGAEKNVGRPAVIVVEPVLGVIRVARRVEVRITDHPAERAARVLVDVTGTAAPAPFRKVMVAAAASVQLTAYVESDGALAIFERPNGSEVDRPGKPHPDNTRIWRFVHDHGAEKLGRILVEFDCTIVARTCLLPAVQENGRKVRRKAAN